MKYIASITLALVTASFAVHAQQAPGFSAMTLNAGMHLIHAEVAAREVEREQGLMFRDRMAPNAGMLFIFPQPASVCMWMKNTLLPLSVAFLDEQGGIVNIEDMQPQTLDAHCSNAPVRYALEMNQGWFRQKNIKPGAVIEGLSRQQR